MELERFTIKNIGCFEEKTFDFSNLTVVFGENRTGKSTLVYALFFALFGRHLNSHLRLKDLCQKGRDFGLAELDFNNNKNMYFLRQFTDRMPEMFIRSGNELNPVSLNAPEDIKTYIPIDPETASLTSFFRESELIYFLQDIPKYNKTLLQSLVGMDQALIVRSRFKKALAKARDFRKLIFNAAPKKKIDILSMELSKRKIEEAEKELNNIEIKYRTLTVNKSQDSEIYKLLQKQYNDKKSSRKNC